MPRHIVIVEDEAAIRHNYEDALRRFGYRVTGYGDRESALSALRRRLPDLVIIDVGLGDELEQGRHAVGVLQVECDVAPTPPEDVAVWGIGRRSANRSGSLDAASEKKRSILAGVSGSSERR